MSDLSIYTDSELLHHLNTGSRGAFDEIYHRHWRAMYCSAFVVLKDEAACMDLLQDVFVWLWEHRGRLQVSVLKAYLLMAVRYKAANYIRRSRVHAAFFEQVERTQVAEETVSPVELKELQAIIGQFTLDLPERCRQVFYLSRFEYLSNKEIAEKLGVSEKTVENQLTIALRKLRVKLGSLSAFNIFL
ncbi:RNA polymerase sigma-70 factor [Chitinophaga sp. GCM10012297]|uniref:RNA polymerase sigma-70 factor n=1 Tax=Chitinophaga chungangae TaxID=2821488 RepID=A0ABS3YJE5_9BACT|nr:RNA polymerase sigma-70 factor [Chitinophaga chungangae]MBO9154805.1 RNA polymerase sigma-70 factor [Chitinophaga chungangae]